MPVWEHGAPGLAFLSRHSDGSCATISLAFASVALLWQGHLHRHICSKQQKPIFCITVLCSYWVGEKNIKHLRWQKLITYLHRQCPVRASQPAWKAGHFQRYLENFHRLHLYIRCCSVEDSPLHFILVCVNMFELKIRSCYFLCLNGWMFQMRFLLLWKIPSSLLCLLQKNVTSFYLMLFYPFKLTFHFLIDLLKIPYILEKKINLFQPAILLFGQLVISILHCTSLTIESPTFGRFCNMPSRKNCIKTVTKWLKKKILSLF